MSLFCNDRKAYYRKHVLREVSDKELSPQLVYGSLLDCLLFTPEDFDKRFIVGDFSVPPLQMKTFTENLVKRAIEQLSSSKEEDFATLARWAYNDTRYNESGEEVAFKQKSMTPEAVLEKFNNSRDCTKYYDYLIDTQVGGKILVTQDIYNKAKIGVDKLRYSTVTGPILCQEDTFDKQVFKQLIILFHWDDIEFKSMLDLVVVDHTKRTIQPYDLKTTHNSEEFPHSYLKFNYYIQAGVYYIALYQWAHENGMEEYTILPMQFLVMDSYNYMSPLIYNTTLNNLNESMDGFSIGSKYYRGIVKLCEELKWHKENDIWDISYANYQNKGIVQLKPFEDENSASQDQEEQDTSRGTEQEEDQ